MRHLVPLCLSLATALSAQSNVPDPQEPARLLRYPHIQGDKIAFVHGGDIWTASSQGGNARRVTSYDKGIELFPRISPDGNWIAFSGEYSGTRQIYVVPYVGGTPRQVTHYPDVGPMPPRGGYDHLPLDWTHDGKKILIRANRTPYGQRVGKYFLVDPFGGGLAKPLQIPEGGPASLSPDGTKLAYNIISREWRTWKRYTAGRAQDVYVYDLRTNEIERITKWQGTDNHPMWIGDWIYFTSDRDGTLNIYRYNRLDKTTRQITHHDGFDVLFPSRGRGGLIYEQGGYLHVMDAKTERVKLLSITLADDKPWLRPTWKDGATGFGAYAPSPSGKRVLVEFRGDIFSAPRENGEVRNLTRSPKRRERAPSWSPDGKTIAYLAEVGADYELFARDAKTGEERQLTEKTGAWILNYNWSPDSQKVGFVAKNNRLMLLDVLTGSITTLDRGKERGLSNWSFSADGKWVTYVKAAASSFSSVFLCSTTNPRPIQVTSDRYQDGSPAFDPKGRYLYFTSARDYKHSDFSFESRMYALLLQKDGPHPLAPRSDEETAEAAKKPTKAGEEKKSTKAGEEKKSAMHIDLAGLGERIVALPSAPGSYRALVGLDNGFLFYNDGALRHYDLDKRKASEVLKGVRGFALTPDLKQLFYRHGRSLCIGKPVPGQKPGAKKIALTGLRVRIVPRDEWAQMYGDAWRIMRDWFYDPEMHRVDWNWMQRKYLPLVRHCSHRSDLDFILGELIGELNCGHTYVTEGETPRVDRVNVGLLGCEFEQVGKHYKIRKIYKGENWNERTRSPLTEPGLGVKVGDFVVAIDDYEVQAPKTPFHFLENTAGRNINIEVNSKPTREGARRVTVKPIRSEGGLRYLAWVENNRRIVDRMSNGRIGYVHVPNTAVDGHRELFKGFRAQARVKQAMIIDDRYNGGGWIPDRMAQALGQPVLNYWSRRGSELNTTPTFAFEGPRAMLINGYSSSGGDAFPFYFRKLKLGTLIGKRTWGGLVGYSGSPRLVDGGGLAVPSFAFVNTNGEWDVEAVGVAPDIEVFDDPTKIQAGTEPTLETAVRHLLGELERRGTPQRPPTPKGPARQKVKRSNR